MRITKIEQPRTPELYQDEYGNTFEVGFDTCAENPVDMWDGAELCVLGAPREHTHTHIHTQQGRIPC